MKARLLPLVPLALVVGCKVQGSPAFESNVAVASMYLFRGVPQVDKPVVQPDANTTLATEGGGEIDVGFWANIDTTDHTGNAVFPDGNAKEVTEVQLKGAYSGHASGTDYTLGFVNYDQTVRPGGQTTELYLALAWDWGDRLTPSIAGYYDIDDVNGFYYRAALDKRFQPSETVDLDVGVGLGITDRDHALIYYGVSESGLADATGHTALTIATGDNTSVKLFVLLSTVIDKDIQDAMELAALDSENLVAGISFGWHY